MKIKHLIANNHDYAVFGHNTANALRTVENNVVDLSLHYHRFGYDSQSKFVREKEMREAMSKSEFIHIMHSDPYILKLALESKHKDSKLIHWATGTRYRQETEKMNNLFNPVVDVSFIALGEFSGLGAKNEVYSVGAIDVRRIKPLKETVSNPVQVYHLPSKPEVKGTSKILEMIDEIDREFDFYYMTDEVPYQEQLENMQKSDIYIELYAPEQNGKPYGSWGITALEAAAMGKAVITQQYSVDVYEQTYGCQPGLILAHSEAEFKQKLTSLIDSPDLIKKRQEMARKWVSEFHSFEATGKNILKNICI